MSVNSLVQKTAQAAANVGTMADNAERFAGWIQQAADAVLSFRPSDPGLSFRPDGQTLDFTPALTAGGHTSGHSRGRGGGGSGGRSGGYSGSGRSSGSGGGVTSGGGGGDTGGPSYAYTFATAGGGSSGPGNVFNPSTLETAVSRGIEKGFTAAADKAGIGISDAILRRALR